MITNTSYSAPQPLNTSKPDLCAYTQGCTYPPNPTAVATPPVQEPAAAGAIVSPGIQTAKMWIGVDPAPEYSFASRLRGPGTDPSSLMSLNTRHAGHVSKVRKVTVRVH